MKIADGIPFLSEHIVQQGGSHALSSCPALRNQHVNIQFILKTDHRFLENSIHLPADHTALQLSEQTDTGILTEINWTDLVCGDPQQTQYFSVLHITSEQCGMKDFQHQFFFQFLISGKCHHMSEAFHEQINCLTFLRNRQAGIFHNLIAHSGKSLLCFMSTLMVLPHRKR